ncbi:hypothetical protein B0H17DRAFT_201939 [Mycena rosella]|uniref:Uncharacterized protein n=1 Tax=Mycena rosella TaxID=1033263 RepID=A0AAD7CZY5_MYCRO|nr:hypothetical protein B0H17DRAFT_201939 [Mycena rosella]
MRKNATSSQAVVVIAMIAATRITTVTVSGLVTCDKRRAVYKGWATGVRIPLSSPHLAPHTQPAPPPPRCAPLRGHVCRCRSAAAHQSGAPHLRIMEPTTDGQRITTPTFCISASAAHTSDASAARVSSSQAATSLAAGRVIRSRSWCPGSASNEWGNSGVVTRRPCGAGCGMGWGIEIGSEMEIGMGWWAAHGWFILFRIAQSFPPAPCHATIQILRFSIHGRLPFVRNW